nr:hypothetical protein [uncultured Ralstonia sp.]
MSAIIAVSEIEKKAEQHSSSATAPICAQSGQESKAGEEGRRSAHYNRGVCCFCADGRWLRGLRNTLREAHRAMRKTLENCRAASLKIATHESFFT